MAYDPNHEYTFTDKDGNTFTSKGDNGYVWQAVTEGIPISVDQNGNWYTEPYLDVEQTGYVAHIPEWFKATKEYEDWQTYAAQIPNLSINKTVYDNLNNILKTLGSQGALRTSLSQDIKSYGVTNQELIDKYVKDIVSMAAEGQGGDKAQINLWGTDYNSAADIARHYKDLSKEDLSSAMTSMYDIMDKGQKGEWTDKEEYLADAVTAAKILNYVDDNHISFGENDEFNGLLSSSVWQQINRGLTQFMGGVSSNTFVGIPARLAYATLNSQYGNGEFNLRIEDLYNDRLATGADLGAGLEGNEAADVVGMWGGAIGSIAVTMAASMTMGSAINGKVATSAPGGFLAKVGTFAQTIPGAAVSDFFLNDVPLDLMMFTTDTMRDGIEKAWFDPENPQPLFGIPFVRQSSDGNFYPSGFGPDVPGGLAMNLVGDAVLDAAIPFLSIVGNATYKGLDTLTGGAVTRTREKAALLNLQIQQKLTDIPILGTGWQKFVNYMMGAENAQFIREARKAAIAEGSMEPYVRAQNLLTLSNHSGMEVVQPLYKQIDDDLGISKTIKDFNKQANTYGGVSETRVEWKEIKDGRTKDFYKVVPDTLPKQVKQGLLDVERLSELKGEIQNEGGLIPNPARNKEIAEIEARLEKTPQAIKDFAEKFSELNKRVEALGVDLGLTTQDWIDALRADPRWESYMTRQALTIGNQTISSGTNPPDAKIITAKRKGYYSENYIDPTLALGMKVEALGRAFAWNERAKAMVGFEISQGKVIAGKAGVDVAARLAEVKQKIKNGVEYRKSIGYDDTLKRVNKDVASVSDAFKKINGLLNLPEQLSLKSVYEATQNPAIKEFISDFNKGEIKFAEGVKEAAGLSDSDAASIIQNTYVQKGGDAKVVAEAKQDIKTFDDLMTDFDNMLSVQKIGDTYEQYQNRAWSEEGANFLFDMKNEAGETDFGIYGVSEWTREKIVDDIDQKINAAEKEFRESGQWQEYASWVSTLGDKKLALRDAERNLVNNNKSKKALKDYDEKLADYEDWYSKRPIGDVTEIDSVARLFAIREQLYMGYPMINTESFVDSKPVISFYGDGDYKEGGFQYLTRGEIRRALYEKGYDNITNKEFKEAIDKADNSFTQRTTQPMVVYRGETADTARTLKVGDKVDSASWTYTAFTPKYTDLYREGITNRKPSGKKTAYDDKGVIFRYHLKEGSPVYVPHKDVMGDWYNQNVNKFKIPTATQEFVLPRNIDGTIVSITKDAKLFSDGSEGNYVTVVDVVVDPRSGVTPKLQSQKIGDGTRKVSWTQEEWDAWNQIDRTLSNMESFELAAKGSHAGILDLRKKLEKNARGQRYKGQPHVAALKQQAIDGLKELGVPTHLIEKIEVPYRLADANIPDTATSPVRTKLEEKAAAAGYSAGVTSEGIPYKYTVENGEITSFERLESSEDYAMATSMLGGVYNMTASTVDRIGKINAAAINRTILYYRDNMPNIGTGPTFFFDGSSGSWGYIWPATYTSQYGWHLENGKIVAEQYPVFLGHSYRAGNEDAALRLKREECESGEKPRNTGTLESTPTHESGHSLMMQLAVHRLNRMAEEGLVKLPEDTGEIGRMVEDAYDDLHALLLDRAMKKMGYEKYTDADVARQARTISKYASSTNYGKDNAGRWKHDEIFSEAQRMYQGNGNNASPFCLAIVEEMKAESERFTTAAAPAEVFAKNNLTAPKGLFKDDQYAFPAKAKTAKQKAKWLDEFRQNNPYIKGKGLLTEENYQLANLWDTFFQKEIRAYDPNSKSSMPDLLAKKNGDFIEDLSKNAAKRMVEEIKKASVEGFSQDLATMVLSRNSGDVTSAMDNFIIGRVNKAAEEVAAKMPGGATEENINTARMTMWSEENIRNDFITMLSALSPDIDGKDITSKINELFDTQAKGYASFEALPVDTKKLIGEQEKLTEKLYKENNYARKKGKEVDQGLTGYRGDVTQVVHYKESGEDVYAVVSDPVIADILKKPSNYKETGVTVEAIASAANFISRSYRIGTTGANPIAFVRNVLRDPLQATIQGGFNPLNMSLSPEVFYHTLRGFGLDDATINNVTQRLSTWASSGTLTSEMRNMGIDTPATLGYRNRVEKVSKKLRDPNSKLNKVVERAEAPLETWESVFRNQIAQQSFVKNYRRTGDVNKAMGAALFDASNSTTNFSHSVGMFSRATSTIPYLSSAINGTRSFWVQFNADPIGMITRITAGFMVPAMAITAWNLSSQERREAYMNLPEWYKSGHLVLIDLEGNTIAFPIPEELGQYFNTTRKLVEFTQEATPYGIGQIMSQGAFGFLPVDMDGFYGEDGSIQVGRGVAQLVSGILPQAATAIYEFAAEKDLFTGQDLSDYNAFQKWINAGTNILGTGFKNVVNDIGYLVGAPSEFRLGKTTADTLARDLFGVGFDNVKFEFMNLVGNPSEIDPVTGKETAATGLFAENEKLQKQIENINAQIAYSSEDKKAELESQKQDLITNFIERVSNLVNKYMNLYTQTGGLEEWQKEKIVKLLTLGRSSSSADSDSYQSASSSDAYLNERALAQQRYVGAGLPAGPSLEALGDNGSIELQAAINRFYGVNKQATQDFKNVVEESGMKDVKDEFYAVMQQIYDAADEQGKDPDYDLIERIQARYLQMMDAALIPLINEYGVGVLNNNDFIDAVRRQVNGMIPSDDWRQSVRNAKKFLSTKDFPTATVDVKKWLKQRYSSGMRNRNLASDPEVTERIESIRNDIDAGRMGAAAGKIEDLKSGINKANFYISSEDLMVLNQLNNMVK